MSDGLVRQLADEILDRAPEGILPASMIHSLSRPTPRALHDSANTLLASGRIEQAEFVFHELLNRLSFGSAAAIGLARVAEKRGDPNGACTAWHDCLSRFPADVQPFWYMELARWQRQLEHHLDAEDALRRCTERFPHFAPAVSSLATLLLSVGRSAEAVAVWRSAIRDFPDQAQPWWIMEFARALEAAGQDDRRETALDSLVDRFREVPEVLAFLARRAATAEDWAEALKLWTRCLATQPAGIHPEWQSGRAMTLFRLWRADEALNVWEDLHRRFPEFVPGYSDMAAAAEELGLWERAGQCWSLLIERFPEKEQPEWRARQVRCRVCRWPDHATENAVAELNTRFPDSPFGAHAALMLAKRLDLGARAFSVLVEDTLRRFPADRETLAQRVIILLAHERLSDAEAVIRGLEATLTDHLALLSRWRLMMERGGDEAIKESAHHALTKRDWAVAPALAICEFLVRIYASWSMDLALMALDALDQRFPGRVAIASARARTLIALGQDQAALRIIGEVPPAYHSQDIMELKAWACARRGDVEGARQIWSEVLSTYYFRAIHSPAPTFDRITSAPEWGNLGGVVAFVPVRDELAQLPEFLRHHRQLGVRHFVVIDNMSTDGSESYLRAQSDVILYRTADDFQTASSGMRWINALIERHGTDKWCLFADADEAFIYPDWERTSLSRLTEYLDEEGAEAVSAFMLDIYPERLFDPAGNPARHSDCRYYDDDYVWIGHVRPPYCRPKGGIRSRLFNVQEYLQKVPLIKSGRGIHIDNHETTSVRFSRVTGALLHHKILGVVSRRDNPWMPNCGIETARRYQRYASRGSALDAMDLCAPGVSQSLTDSLALADRGLIQAPLAYREWARRVKLSPLQ